MLREKVKSIWNEHKEVICFVGGGLVVGVVAIGLSKSATRKILKRSIVLQKAADARFPVNMSVAEIKEVISKIEGAKIFDAVAADIGGGGYLFIRSNSAKVNMSLMVMNTDALI